MRQGEVGGITTGAVHMVAARIDCKWPWLASYPGHGLGSRLQAMVSTG